MLKLYCICIHKDRLLLKTRPSSEKKGVFQFKNFWIFLCKSNLLSLSYETTRSCIPKGIEKDYS